MPSVMFHQYIPLYLCAVHTTDGRIGIQTGGQVDIKSVVWIPIQK